MTGDRIVGGEDATSSIPWQVSVRNGQSGGGHFCGGTILDETTIMCAAHCFNCGQSMSGKYITAGVVNRNDDSGQTIEIANGVWNANMPYQGNNNDFIILKLSSPLTFNENVYPACLPDADHAPDDSGETCFVSGWGTLESGANTLPNNLQWVAVPTVTNDQCSQSYGNGITDSMICAGFPEGGKDSCQGDSGGPFVCRDNGKAVLTGVVSFGIGCADADYPGVYARVTAVLDWVKENMGENGTSGPAPVCCIDNWIGDNFCDDQNNNAECGFDGGDCCQEEAGEGWDNYCSECLCIEIPDTTDGPTEEPTEGPTEGPTEVPTEVPTDGPTEGPTVGPTEGPTEGPGDCIEEWIGDSLCDDENNNSECGFDGGDCCQEEPGDGWDNYCQICECLEAQSDCIDQWIGDNFCDDLNNNSECEMDGGDCCQEEPIAGWDQYCNDCFCIEIPETTEAPIETTEAPSECVDQWIGDNYCDDQNNNPECDFDGGDCCQEDAEEGWDDYCEICECFDFPETTQAPEGSNCLFPQWFGDNYCDDENNNSECNFDGGDCCGDDVNTMYCSECACFE